MINVIYFSNVSNNTHRFISKLDLDTDIERIPVKGEYEGTPDEPYILITPTYGESGVPVQVRKFISKAKNRKMLAGVIATGNTNFGKDYAKAGHVISDKCKVPLLYTLELFGTTEDVTKVKEGLENYVVRHNN